MKKEKMKAAVLTKFGTPDVLQIQERLIPQPQDNEVLIKVTAAGINRADLAQRKGHYPAPKGAVQDIPGLEVSGIVAATGDRVALWKEGDEVCALVPGGGYAEYVCADAGSVLPLPKTLSLEEAAALPEVLLTVWQNIFQIGQLKPDENVLIYGGSGGIGSMAIQLTQLYGAHPYSLASTPEKITYCKALGAEKVANYRSQDLVAFFGKNSVDLILDAVGGTYLKENLEVLKPEGRLVYINAMEGKGELDIFKVMQKRIRITGSTLRSRTLAHKKQLAEAVVQKAFPLIASPNFSVQVRQSFPLAEAAKAHELMESRDFMGKIILVTAE